MKAAFFDRVSLSAVGFHATPGISYDFATNSGNAFNYFTYGVGCSMVEIDCLTGDHQVCCIMMEFISTRTLTADTQD